MEISMRELADFAWSKGAAEFDYTDNKNCALCQFLKEVKGLHYPDANDLFFWDDERVSHRIPSPIADALPKFPENFLALAGRLECLIVEQEKSEGPLTDEGDRDCSADRRYVPLGVVL